MPKKVAFIQTGGIGDLIMILPIADFYEEQGWKIVWPIDERFVAMFQRVKPTVEFLPVPGGPAYDRTYHFDLPLSLLAKHGCEKTIIFYVPMHGLNFSDPRLAASLKFDEYKYAIAGVPFSRKWDLKYARDLKREQALYDRLDIRRPFVCVHDEGSNFQIPVPIPDGITKEFQIVRVSTLTDSVFDWLLTFERASKLIFLDGCFANLVDQLRLDVEKHLVLRSRAEYTPVFRSGWKFVYFDAANITPLESLVPRNV